MTNREKLIRLIAIHNDMGSGVEIREMRERLGSFIFALASYYDIVITAHQVSVFETLEEMTS